MKKFKGLLVGLGILLLTFALWAGVEEVKTYYAGEQATLNEGDTIAVIVNPGGVSSQTVLISYTVEDSTGEFHAIVQCPNLY